MLTLRMHRTRHCVAKRACARNKRKRKDEATASPPTFSKLASGKIAALGRRLRAKHVHSAFGRGLVKFQPQSAGALFGLLTHVMPMQPHAPVATYAPMATDPHPAIACHKILRSVDVEWSILLHDHNTTRRWRYRSCYFYRGTASGPEHSAQRDYRQIWFHNCLILYDRLLYKLSAGR
jgi:hypothetical protein